MKTVKSTHKHRYQTDKTVMAITLTIPDDPGLIAEWVSTVDTSAQQFSRVSDLNRQLKYAQRYWRIHPRPVTLDAFGVNCTSAWQLEHRDLCKAVNDARLSALASQVADPDFFPIERLRRSGDVT